MTWADRAVIIAGASAWLACAWAACRWEDHWGRRHQAGGVDLSGGQRRDIRRLRGGEDHE